MSKRPSLLKLLWHKLERFGFVGAFLFMVSCLLFAMLFVLFGLPKVAGGCMFVAGVALFVILFSSNVKEK
jgi:uncharacterized membrane protein